MSPLPTKLPPELLAIAKELNDPKKGYGEGTVVLGSDIVVPDRITTGSIALDAALGGGWPVNQWHEIVGNPSDGKALDADTPIPTPFGWVTMEKVQTGDFVFDETGFPCLVTFATGLQHGRTCYEVKFSGGSALVADAEHQWTVLEKCAEGQLRERTLTTQDMFNAGVFYQHSTRAYRFTIPVCGALEYADQDLLVDPYALGAWFGEGTTLRQRSVRKSKHSFLQHKIMAITPVVSRPVKCIQVDSPRSLYLAGRACIPTHNSTICHKTIAANQELDPNFTTVWLAAETYDVNKAAMDGVDNDRVIVLNEAIMERGFEMVLKYLGSKLVDFIVIDSLPALTPGEEAEKAMDELGVALGARLTNKFFRKQGTSGRRQMTGGERPCTGIVVNQWRNKIGVQFGDPRTTPGGVGKDFAFYTRMEVRRDEWVEVGPATSKIRVGQTIFARTTKNKSFSPQKVARWDYFFSECTDRSGRPHPAGTYDSFKEAVGLGVVYGVITQGGGGYYTYGDLRVQGLANFLTAISGDVALTESLEKEVLTAATSNSAVAIPVPFDEDMESLDAKPVVPQPKRARPPKAVTPAPPVKKVGPRRPTLGKK